MESGSTAAGDAALRSDEACARAILDAALDAVITIDHLVRVLESIKPRIRRGAETAGRVGTGRRSRLTKPLGGGSVEAPSCDRQSRRPTSAAELPGGNPSESPSGCE